MQKSGVMEMPALHEKRPPLWEAFLCEKGERLVVHHEADHHSPFLTFVLFATTHLIILDVVVISVAGHVIHVVLSICCEGCTYVIFLRELLINL